MLDWIYIISLWAIILFILSFHCHNWHDWKLAFYNLVIFFLFFVGARRQKHGKH